MRSPSAFDPHHFYSHCITVQQIDVRNEQARLLPLQYHLIMERLNKDLPSAAAQYIKRVRAGEVWLR
jgi:hypothetical protein